MTFLQRKLAEQTKIEGNATKVIQAGRLAAADLAGVYLERGQARLQMNQIELAKQDLEQARKGLPNDLRVSALSASIALRMGNYANAEADYSRALIQGADAGGTYLQRGHVRFLQSRYADALQDFVQAERATTTGVNVGFMQIWANLMRLKLGERLQVTSQTGTQWPGPLLLLIEGRMTPGQVILAAKTGSQDETLSNLCEAYFYVAMWYWVQGDMSQRDEYLKKALATEITSFMEYQLAELLLKK